MKNSKSEVVTLETCLGKLNKCKRKLGSEFYVIEDILRAAVTSRDSYWQVTKNEKSHRPNYICSDCGKVQAAPVKYCPSCGSSKIDENGIIKKK